MVLVLTRSAGHCVSVTEGHHTLHWLHVMYYMGQCPIGMMKEDEEKIEFILTAMPKCRAHEQLWVFPYSLTSQQHFMSEKICFTVATRWHATQHNTTTQHKCAVFQRHDATPCLSSWTWMLWQIRQISEHRFKSAACEVSTAVSEAIIIIISAIIANPLLAMMTRKVLYDEWGCKVGLSTSYRILLLLLLPFANVAHCTVSKSL